MILTIISCKPKVEPDGVRVSTMTVPTGGREAREAREEGFTT